MNNMSVPEGYLRQCFSWAFTFEKQALLFPIKQSERLLIQKLVKQVTSHSKPEKVENNFDENEEYKILVQNVNEIFKSIKECFLKFSTTRDKDLIGEYYQKVKLIEDEVSKYNDIFISHLKFVGPEKEIEFENILVNLFLFKSECYKLKQDMKLMGESI